MSQPRPSRDALCGILHQMSIAAGIAVIPEKGGTFSLVPVNRSGPDFDPLVTSGQSDGVLREEVRDKARLLSGTDIGAPDPVTVFIEQNGGDQYQLRWVAVNPNTLEPLLIDGRQIACPFNPI